MRVTMPGYTGYDLVADYSAPGLVVYWLEPKPNVPVYVLQRVPNKRLVRQRNWSPVSGYQPQPGYAITLNEACGYALISIGGTIILVTLVEDIATVGLGTIDDVVTLPAGYMLIDTGNRLAQYVPVSQQVPAY